MGVRQHSTRSALHGAFTFTLFGSVLLLTGSMGYTLKKSSDGFISTRWSPGVIWPEVWWGLGLSLAAVYLWRRGLQSLK